MNPVYIINGLVLVIFLFTIIRGYKRGFLAELISLVALVVALFIAYLASPVLASQFPIFNSGSDIAEKIISILLSNLVWFIIVFVIVRVLLAFVVGLTKLVSHLPLIGEINRILGSLMGLINGTVLCVVLTILLNIPMLSEYKAVVDQSFLKLASDFSNHLIKSVAEKIDYDKYLDSLNDIDIEAYRVYIEDFIKGSGVVE